MNFHITRSYVTYTSQPNEELAWYFGGGAGEAFDVGLIPCLIVTSRNPWPSALGPWPWVTRASGWNLPQQKGDAPSRTLSVTFSLFYVMWGWKTALKYAETQGCRAQISNKYVTWTSANVTVSKTASISKNASETSEYDWTRHTTQLVVEIQNSLLKEKHEYFSFTFYLSFTICLHLPQSLASSRVTPTIFMSSLTASTNHRPKLVCSCPTPSILPPPSENLSVLQWWMT